MVMRKERGLQFKHQVRSPKLGENENSKIENKLVFQ